MSIVTLNPLQSHQDLVIDPGKITGLRGKITIPGDKSISHRSLMLGAIAEGETVIHGLLLGEDPRSTASCFRAMGVEISQLNSEKVIVKGRGLGNLQEPLEILDAGNSGTTIRLMLGLLAGHRDRFFVVTGDASLRSRPMSRVVKPLKEMGAQIWGRKANSLAPLAVSGESLQPIHYYSPVASAQVANIEVDGETNSVTVTGYPTLTGQTVIVPGDISSAAFWLVAGAIVPNSELLIENVGINPTRTGVLQVLQAMGADITLENQRVVTGEPVADLRVKSSQLQATTIAGEIIPRLIDEIPILAVAAVFAQGTTIIKDAEELRVKESDRLTVMATQLDRLGAKVRELPDGLEITGGTGLVGTEVDSFTDHRIAMSLAIAALNSRQPTTIHRAEAAGISYPDFFSTLQQICQE